jgi:thioester reductase-like protein
VLLTGATGFLGQYLLRDLLLRGFQVTVLARQAGTATAADRIAALLDHWARSLGRILPAPTVLSGDVAAPGLGLGVADQRWLGWNCGAVIHAAANLSFRPTGEGEPWRTNCQGTQHLLELMSKLGMEQLHHVSTAFVCGRRRGVIREDELECGQEFHNGYEQSKYEAEQRIRAQGGLHVTCYRPAVIVGDSRTGYTSSYDGMYRFLELAARLADAFGAGGRRRRLPLRLPVSGDEACNLVPVDWVAATLVELVARPAWHGQTYHVVAREPIRCGLVRDIATEELGLEGVELTGPATNEAPGRLEEIFLEGLQEYWPYLGGTPAFDDANTAAALPQCPPPRVDGPLLRRLIRFAVADGWGRGRVVPAATAPVPLSFCAEYIEQQFPRRARQSNLARAVGLEIVVGVHIQGPGGGEWSCRWLGGELSYVRRGLAAEAEVIYSTDTDTFAAVVQGRLTPQQAFFEKRIAIRGDWELALKLAALFHQFLRETPSTESAAHGGARCHSPGKLMPR